MRILITGAFGMIGRQLVRELEGAHELRFFDREKPESATVFVPGSNERKAVPFVTSWPCLQGDITDKSAMLGAVRDMDAVIHLAASVKGQPEHGSETFHINVCGTYILLDACRQAGVKRFFCASSVNAFGTFYFRLSGQPVRYDEMPLDESFRPVPEDAYSLSKYVNEETCAAFTRAYGITTAAFRFAGAWSDEMYRQRLRDGLQQTRAWSDGLYQWVHVADVARGLRQALESPDLPATGVYTLGASDTSCPEPTMEILRRLRPDLADRVSAPLPGRASLLSIQKAHQVFAYTPQYNLDAAAAK